MQENRIRGEKFQLRQYKMSGHLHASVSLDGWQTRSTPTLLSQ